MQHEDYPQQPAETQMAPPVDAGDLFLQPQESGWPKVIGIIAIVFGALGTLGAVIGVMGQLMIEQVSEMMPEAQQKMLAAQREWHTWLVFDQALRFIAAVLLIVAGAKLTGRAARSAQLMRVWAVLKLAVVALGTAVNYPVTKAQFETIQDDPKLGTAGVPSGFMDLISQFLLGCVALWGSALPVFVLIWFARRRIKSEVASWGETEITNY